MEVSINQWPKLWYSTCILGSWKSQWINGKAPKMVGLSKIPFKMDENWGPPYFRKPLYDTHVVKTRPFFTTHFWMVTIPPIKMVMTGGWLIIVLTTFYGTKNPGSTRWIKKKRNNNKNQAPKPINSRSSEIFRLMSISIGLKICQTLDSNCYTINCQREINMI